MECLFCRQQGLDRTLYVLHTNAHFKDIVDPRQYVCSKCNRKFPRRDRWKKHILAQKCNEKTASVAKCLICNNELYSQQVLQRHMRTHQPAMFKCLVCPREFRSESKLQQHTASNICVTKNPCCPLYDRVFNCKQTMPRSEDRMSRLIGENVQFAKEYISQYVKPTGGTAAQQRVSDLLEVYYRSAVVTFYKSGMWNTIMNHVRYHHSRHNPDGGFYWLYCTPISIVYNAFEHIDGEGEGATRTRFQASMHPYDQVFINRLYNRNPMVAVFCGFRYEQIRPASDLQKLIEFSDYGQPFLLDLNSWKEDHTSSQEYQYRQRWDANPPNTIEDALTLQAQYLRSVQHRFQFVPELKPRWARIFLELYPGDNRRYRYESTALFDDSGTSDEYGLSIPCNWNPYGRTGLVHWTRRTNCVQDLGPIVRDESMPYSRTSDLLGM